MTFEHYFLKRLLSAFEALSEIRAIRVALHFVKHAILFRMKLFDFLYL